MAAPKKGFGRVGSGVGLAVGLGRGVDVGGAVGVDVGGIVGVDVGGIVGLGVAEGGREVGTVVAVSGGVSVIEAPHPLPASTSSSSANSQQAPVCPPL